MSDHQFSPDELRLAELLHQVLALSDDTENAGRVTFRSPTGAFIGEATLSVREIEAVTDSLISLNQAIRAQEDPDAAWVAMTEPDLIEDDDVDKFVAEVEAYVSGEQP